MSNAVCAIPEGHSTETPALTRKNAALTIVFWKPVCGAVEFVCAVRNKTARAADCKVRMRRFA